MNSTKDLIMGAIRQNMPKEAHPYPQIPAFAKSKKPILDEFKENLVEAAGTWHDIHSREEAERLIHQLHPDAKLICSATPEIKGNKDLSQITDPHELNDVDVGIIRARFGVSETGMVYITGKDMHITSLGFLSQHLIILLDPVKMVRDMYEAYSHVELESNHYSCFMLGPSATADIGAVMVRGAQGARSLSVFFM